MFLKERETAPSEPSSAIRERVVAARDRQRARLAPFGVRCNAAMTSSILRATCKLDATSEARLAELVETKLSITARGVDRLLKVARTVADLLGHDAIDPDCLDEAASFRDADALNHTIANVA